MNDKLLTFIGVGIAIIMGIGMLSFGRFTVDVLGDKLNSNTVQVEQIENLDEIHQLEKMTYEEIIDIYGLEEGLKIIEKLESK